MMIAKRKNVRQMSVSCSKMVAGLCLAVILLCSAALPAQAVRADDTLTNQIQVAYHSQNGLPTSEANTVCQTKDGYIWIGSYGGLLRYDGMNMTNFSRQENGLNTSGIRALFEDSDGTLWVGSNDMGVYRYKDGAFEPCQGSDSLKSVRCFTQMPDGTLFVGTATGLAKVVGNTLVPVTIPELSNQTVYTLTVDSNGVLWGTAGAGIAFALKDEKIVYWFATGDLSENENYSVLANGNKIYIGTSGTLLLRLTITDDNYTAYSYQFDKYETPNRWTINCLYKTRDDMIWLGSNNGPAYFDGAMRFHSAEHLSADTFISGICEDYEGNIWLASTKHGVFQVTNGKFYQPVAQLGFQGESINAICRLNQMTYAASDTGLSITDESWHSIENDLVKMLGGIRIRNLSKDSKGNLWVSTYSDYGLIRYTPQTEEIVTISKAEGLPSNKVRLSMELSDGRIAVATTAGVAILEGTSLAKTYQSEQGIENLTILSLLEAKDGTLLAGSDGGGIYSIKNDTVTHIGQQQGLRSSVVLRMTEEKETGGVFISAGSELYYMKDGAVSELTSFQTGIGSVFDMVVVDENLWLLKSSGVIIAPRSALADNDNSKTIQYGMENGLIGDITANSWSYLDKDVLYLCTKEGICLLDKERIHQNRISPKTTVNQITVTGESGAERVYQNPKKIKLESNDQRLTIQFAVLSYGTASANAQYYMEGFDKETATTAIRDTNTVSYTNLKGGSYVFHLMATNVDGTENGVGTTVIIEKKLGLLEHKSVWAVLLLLVILCGVLVTRLVLEVKVRKLKKRQQEYREITDQALRTIANTIDAKDKYTNGHSQRVAAFSRVLAQKLGMNEEEQEKVFYIALLHDIGKIGIPDSILNKPERLTEEEFHIIQSHTQIGSDILKDFTAIPGIGDGVKYHHERMDGTGYQNGIVGEAIPYYARIIGVADAFDAMKVPRVYRDGLSIDEILSELKNGAGTQFDEKVVKAAIEAITEQGEEIKTPQK